MKLKKLIILSILSFISGCSSNMPVTFYGQSVGDYIRNENENNEFYPGLSYSPEHIQRKWKLRSFGSETVPYGILLEDLDLWLNLSQKAGETGYKYSGHSAINSFSGEYEFDEKGSINILSMGATRVGVVGDKGRIENRFMGGIKNAVTFKISGSGSHMRLYSQEEFLDFYTID